MIVGRRKKLKKNNESGEKEREIEKEKRNN